MKDSYSFHTVRPAAAPEAQAHRKLPAGVIRFGCASDPGVHSCSIRQTLLHSATTLR